MDYSDIVPAGPGADRATVEANVAYDLRMTGRHLFTDAEGAEHEVATGPYPREGAGAGLHRMNAMTAYEAVEFHPWLLAARSLLPAPAPAQQAPAPTVLFYLVRCVGGYWLQAPAATVERHFRLLGD